MPFFGAVKKLLDLYGEDIKCTDMYSGIFADYYDTLAATQEETAEYMREAFACGRNVLELCCGNGRLTTAFAERGFHIDGVDLSEDMLSRLRKRVSALSSAAARKIHVRRMDIFSITAEQKYDFIFLPATTICLFAEERKTVIRLLDKVSGMLRPGGRFMFDLRIYPVRDGIQTSGIQMEPMLLNHRKTMVRFQEQMDYGKRIATGNFYLQITRPDGGLEQWATATQKKIIMEEDMDSCIADSSLDIAEKIPAKIWGGDVLYYLLEKPAGTESE